MKITKQNLLHIGLLLVAFTTQATMIIDLADKEALLPLVMMTPIVLESLLYGLLIGVTAGCIYFALVIFSMMVYIMTDDLPLE